jgi:catechol 2,3-dioxygenase-like lactoylglutathione lyase family enzyme
MPVAPPPTVIGRYIVHDVDAAIAWYTKHLGFTVLPNAAPAFANVTLGSLRLLLGGPTSSAGRPMPNGARPEAGGWNRVHFIVDDLPGEVARLRAVGVQFRNDIVRADPAARKFSERSFREPGGGVLAGSPPIARRGQIAASLRVGLCTAGSRQKASVYR